MKDGTRRKIDEALRLLEEADKELSEELQKTKGPHMRILGIQLGGLAAAKAALETVA